jgi:hypothetical protein
MSGRRRGILLGATLAVIALGGSLFAAGNSEHLADPREPLRDRLAAQGRVSRVRAIVGRAPQEAPGQMRGIARGDDGKPLSNALVCAWCAYCNMAFSENRPYCVRTNDKGEYDLTGLPAGKYRLVVSAEERGMVVGNGAYRSRSGATVR